MGECGGEKRENGRNDGEREKGLSEKRGRAGGECFCPGEKKPSGL